MNKNLYWLIVIVVIVVASCKRESVIHDNPDNPPATPSGSELQLIADSVYLFSREIYLWDEIRTPTYDYNNFKPRDLNVSPPFISPDS